MSRAGSASTDRAESVKRMFSEIAPTYDLLNTVLSLGIDARWRAQAAGAALDTRAAAGPGAFAVLDVATGTGKLALTIKRLCRACRVVGVDFAEPMLEVARRAVERSKLDVELEVADGTALPYEDASFDAVTIAYGLRNFADPAAGLREFTRVLPRLGGLVSGRRSAYAYLPASVISFMTPDELAAQMTAAGLEGVSYRLQTFGISAMHVAHAPRTEPAALTGGAPLTAAAQAAGGVR